MRTVLSPFGVARFTAVAPVVLTGVLQQCLDPVHFGPA
jgi:hypothetical protein